MVFTVHVLLALAGFGIISMGRLPVGEREVRTPLSSLIGFVLCLSLPLSVILITLVAAPDTMRLAPKMGLRLAYQEALIPFWWLHPVLLLIIVGTAGALTYMGLRHEEIPIVPPQPEAPVSPSDLLQRSDSGTGPREGISTVALPWGKATPAAPPQLPPVVGRYHAPGKGIPPEIEALGTAKVIHRPAQLGGLSSLWAKAPTTSVACFDQGLVTITDDDFVLVPWHAITSFSNGTLRTQDQQSVPLPTQVENAAHLVLHIRQRLMDRLLGEIVSQLEDGQEVSLGAITLTSEGLSYNNRMLPWFEICHARIHEGRSLHVTRGNSPLPWCMIPLERLDNDFLILDLIAKFAPGAVQTV